MTAIIKVSLFAATEDDVLSAKDVEKLLFSKYDIQDVTVRATSALATKSHATVETSSMWVVWEGESTGSVQKLNADFMVPILEVAKGASPSDVAWAVAKFCSLGSPDLAQKVKVVALERRQAKFVEDAQLKTMSMRYIRAISQNQDDQQQITGSGAPDAIVGKVRDRILLNDKQLALVTTDRQSGFDRQLALVPFKGAVLNLTSAFWFEETKDIINNHILSIPHPYVTISKKCQPFPIEFVVRYVPTITI